MIKNINKFIHLLYVPTMNCNLACSYCYLGDNTQDLSHDDSYLNTLVFAVDKFLSAGVMPFNISLHGGEVTTLAKEDFRDIIGYIFNYYRANRGILSDAGFKVGEPHIKTNLYNLEKHIDTIRDFNVSVSGSLDLPLSLHDEYRLTKGGKGTLDRILENVRLLETLPNRKKVSATLFSEHVAHTDEIIRDIQWLADNTCLDMNDFNFMVGFVPKGGSKLHAMTADEQAEFHDRMYGAFAGTELDWGLRNTWFAEFGPGYCTNCDNCGEKFFLLERDGSIYSCVRGQRDPDCFYGNIFTDSVETILLRAREKMLSFIRRQPFNTQCADCGYLYLCKTGCPYVKNTYGTDLSYTCALQKKMYAAEPEKFPPDSDNEARVYDYVSAIYPQDSRLYRPKTKTVLPGQLPPITDIISSDPKLQKLYEEGIFILSIDENDYIPKPQILRLSREIVTVFKDSSITLYVKEGVLEAAEYPFANSLYIMLLSGNMLQYGDEGRIKQEHIMTHQIFTRTLQRTESDRPGFYKADLTEVLRPYYEYLSQEEPANIFFTTSDLRDYHYIKHKNNAYYHIQAINLPFHNIELDYIDPDKAEEMFQ